MKIAIHLRGTLIPEGVPFPCEPASFLSQRLLPSGPRLHSASLLRDLRKAGHYLTLYSNGPYSLRNIHRWCQLNNLPFDEFIVLDSDHFSVWPPVQGQDLIVDSSALHIEIAEYYSVRGLLIPPDERDWANRIYQALVSTPPPPPELPLKEGNSESIYKQSRANESAHALEWGDTTDRETQESGTIRQ